MRLVELDVRLRGQAAELFLGLGLRRGGIHSNVNLWFSFLGCVQQPSPFLCFAATSWISYLVGYQVCNMVLYVPWDNVGDIDRYIPTGDALHCLSRPVVHPPT